MNQMEDLLGNSKKAPQTLEIDSDENSFGCSRPISPVQQISVKEPPEESKIQSPNNHSSYRMALLLEVDSSLDQDDFNDVPDVIPPISYSQQGTPAPFKSKFQGAFQRQLTKIVEDNPPLPLFPKSSTYQGESPRSGSSYNFLKLSKFRGKDFGKSKME